jgi:Arc/MetJ-type ribon-helix-helix transcriptional regulator
MHKSSVGYRVPNGNYRSISINDELVDRVKMLIEKLGTYRSVAEFVCEAVRLRIETLEKQVKTRDSDKSEN